jgi:hypothetical protein
MSTCYAIPNPIFQPAMRLVASITQSNPALVTTTFAHQYLTGLIVRLDIPLACGMQQINQQVFEITVTSATTFTIKIDTTNFDAFVIPDTENPHINTCACVVPVGEDNAQLYQATRNILPFPANS